MEKLNISFKIAELIVKKISGELEDHEQNELQLWEAESEENKLLLQKLLKTKGQAEHDKLLKQINVDKAWNKYSKAISSPRKINYLNIWRYAAAVLIPAALLILVFVYNSRFVDNREAELQQIVPGTKNATLVLDNGKSIDLESIQKLELEEKDGTKILKKDDLLTYEEVDDAKKKQKVLNNTLNVPRGGEYNLVLADGTKVYVNSMSKLTFPVKFVGESREVTLEGEACFMVKKDASHPFIVNVNGLKIEVLGTTFNVNAYQDDNNIITTLVEGKVMMTELDNPSNSVLLNPDEQVVFNTNQKQLLVSKVDASKYIQWIDGVYVFNNQSLEDIMRTLSRWYDFNYWFEQEDLKELKFEGGLNKYESIEPILDILESTGKVDINVNGKNILFMKK